MKITAKENDKNDNANVSITAVIIISAFGRMTGAFTWPSCTAFATNVN